MESLVNIIHLVHQYSMSGIVHSTTWCLIGQLLKYSNILKESFIIYWDEIESVLSVLNMSIYEIILNTQYDDESGFSWWLRSVYYLIKEYDSKSSNDVVESEGGGQVEDGREAKRMKKDMILLMLLRWWIRMNVTTASEFQLSTRIEDEDEEEEGKKWQYCSLTSSSSSSHNRTAACCIYSFTIQQSFLFLILMKEPLADIFKMILMSYSQQEDGQKTPLYLQLQYNEIMKNFPAIIVILFEILEDALLLNNGIVIKMGIDICIMLLKVLNNIIVDIMSMSRSYISEVMLLKWLCSLYDCSYITSVYEQLVSIYEHEEGDDVVHLINDIDDFKESIVNIINNLNTT